MGLPECQALAALYFEGDGGIYIPQRSLGLAMVGLGDVRSISAAAGGLIGNLSVRHVSQRHAHNMKMIHLMVITLKMMERRWDTVRLEGVSCSFSLQACASSETSSGVSRDALSTLHWRASTNSGPMWKHIESLSSDVLLANASIWRL